MSSQKITYRFLSLLLAFILLASIIPSNLMNLKAKAATSGYYTYSVSGGNATITDVDTSISGAVAIPSTLGNNGWFS